MTIDRQGIKPSILDYARGRGRFGITQLASELGMNENTARQYLSALAKENRLARVGNGEYMLTNKQLFRFVPSETLKKLYRGLKKILPYTDFCVYDGGIFNSLHHNVAVNHALYVETNRDAVDSVFCG